MEKGGGEGENLFQIKFVCLRILTWKATQQKLAGKTSEAEGRGGVEGKSCSTKIVK